MLGACSIFNTWSKPEANSSLFSTFIPSETPKIDSDKITATSEELISKPNSVNKSLSLALRLSAWSLELNSWMMAPTLDIYYALKRYKIFEWGYNSLLIIPYRAISKECFFTGVFHLTRLHRDLDAGEHKKTRSRVPLKAQTVAKGKNSKGTADYLQSKLINISSKVVKRDSHFYSEITLGISWIIR